MQAMRAFLKEVFLLSALVGTLSAPCLAAPIPPNLKKVVTFILIESGHSDLVPIGTGFFVGIRDSTDPGLTWGYFVTARHVLTRPTDGHLWPEVFLRVNKQAGGIHTGRLALVAEGPDKSVFFHPDSTVDLAVVPIVPDVEQYDFLVIPDSMITSRDKFADLGVVEGADVFFIGLFTLYLGEAQNYPVVRFGRVALATTEKVSWNGLLMDLYLMETFAYGGNSGAPVFFYLGVDRQPGSIFVGTPELYLAGVMMGAFQDVTPVYELEAAGKQVSLSNMGIAAVVPAYKLRELLFGEELSGRRR